MKFSNNKKKKLYSLEKYHDAQILVIIIFIILEISHGHALFSHCIIFFPLDIFLNEAPTSWVDPIGLV